MVLGRSLMMMNLRLDSSSHPEVPGESNTLFLKKRVAAGTAYDYIMPHKRKNSDLTARKFL